MLDAFWVDFLETKNVSVIEDLTITAQLSLCRAAASRSRTVYSGAKPSVLAISTLSLSTLSVPSLRQSGLLPMYSPVAYSELPKLSV